MEISENFQPDESFQESLRHHLEQNREKWATRLQKSSSEKAAEFSPLEDVDNLVEEREQHIDRFRAILSDLDPEKPVGEIEDLALKLTRLIDLFSEGIDPDKLEATRLEIFSRDKDNPF